MTSLPIALSGALSAALLHFIWQGAAVALLLWVALALMRKQAASRRYAVCCSALGLLAAMPVVTVWLLYVPPPAITGRAVFIAPVAGFHGFGVITPVRWVDLARPWILPMWALGVVFFSFRMIWFCGQAAWMRRRGEQASEWLVSTARELALRMGVTQKFRVLVSARADGPSVIGWLRPVIVVPAAAIAGLTPDQLEAVLAHELAHILRADYLVNLLQTLIETLLFYHPAVWWISGRIRCERELCCDDMAVRSCGDALTYARALSVLEKLRMTVPRMAMASTGGPLSYRIRRIVGAESAAAGFSMPGVVALTIVLAFGAMSLNRARGQGQQTSPVKVPVIQVASAPVPPDTNIPANTAEKAPADQPVVSTTGEPQVGQDSKLALIEDLRKQLATLSADLSPEHPEIRRLQRLLGEAEAQFQTARSAPERAYGANAELAHLWQEFDALSQIYRPEHPNIVRIRKRIDEILAQIKEDQVRGDSTAVAITREQALDLQRLRGQHGSQLAAVQRAQTVDLPKTAGTTNDETLAAQKNKMLVDLARYRNLLMINATESEKQNDPEQKRRLDNERLILETQITYLENELKLTEQFSNSPDMSPEVEKITVSGLSSEAEARVRAQMGIRVGSHLSSFRFPSAYPIAGSDKRLEFAIVMLPDGNAEVRITATTK